MFYLRFRRLFRYLVLKNLLEVSLILLICINFSSLSYFKVCLVLNRYRVSPLFFHLLQSKGCADLSLHGQMTFFYFKDQKLIFDDITNCEKCQGNCLATVLTSNTITNTTFEREKWSASPPISG